MSEKYTYGYNGAQFQKFRKYAWLTLLSFGFTYLFFYNGRQNINLVLPLMKEAFQSDLGTLGVVSSALFWCYAFGQLVSGLRRAERGDLLPEQPGADRHPVGPERLLPGDGLVQRRGRDQQMVAQGKARLCIRIGNGFLRRSPGGDLPDGQLVPDPQS